MRLAAAAMSKNEPEGESGRGVIINTASIAAYEGVQASEHHGLHQSRKIGQVDGRV